MNPGVKAVCIDDGPCRCCNKVNGLVRRAIYVLLAWETPSDGIERVQILGYRSKCGCPEESNDWAGSWRFRQLGTPEPIKQQEITHA